VLKLGEVELQNEHEHKIVCCHTKTLIHDTCTNEERAVAGRFAVMNRNN
jgi:hypothetical protein